MHVQCVYVCIYIVYVCNVCICVYVYIYICMYVRICKYVCMYMHICMYLRTYVCVYLCTFVGMCACTHTYVCAYVCVSLRTYMWKYCVPVVSANKPENIRIIYDNAWNVEWMFVCCNLFSFILIFLFNFGENRCDSWGLTVMGNDVNPDIGF